MVSRKPLPPRSAWQYVSGEKNGSFRDSSGLRPVSKSLKPLWWYKRAKDRPMPSVAPVMNTVFCSEFVTSRPLVDNYVARHSHIRSYVTIRLLVVAVASEFSLLACFRIRMALGWSGPSAGTTALGILSNLLARHGAADSRSSGRAVLSTEMDSSK